MKRTFIAIPVAISPELHNLLALLKEQLKGEAINWVEPAKMHLTVKFLGDTPDHLIAPVSELVESIMGDFTRESGEIAGLDYFIFRGNPSVLYARLENLDVPERLAARLEKALQQLGFQPEKRKFNAHLTLARIKYLKNQPTFAGLLGRYKNQEIQPVSLDKVIFFESLLFPTGPVYKPIRIYTLRNS